MKHADLAQRAALLVSVRWLLWPLAGALAAVSVLVFPSIGILIALCTAAAAVSARRRGSADGAAAGVVAGVGAVLLAIGLANLGYDPCPSSGTVTLAPGQSSSSCGGTSPVPWLAVGSALLLAGIGNRLTGGR